MCASNYLFNVCASSCQRVQYSILPFASCSECSFVLYVIFYIAMGPCKDCDNAHFYPCEAPRYRQSRRRSGNAGTTGRRHGFCYRAFGGTQIGAGSSHPESRVPKKGKIRSENIALPETFWQTIGINKYDDNPQNRCVIKHSPNIGHPGYSYPKKFFHRPSAPPFTVV